MWASAWKQAGHLSRWRQLRPILQAQPAVYRAQARRSQTLAQALHPAARGGRARQRPRACGVHFHARQLSDKRILGRRQAAPRGGTMSTTTAPLLQRHWLRCCEYNISGVESARRKRTFRRMRQVLVREAFKIYEEVLGIDFVEVAYDAGLVDFFFKDNDSGAYTSLRCPFRQRRRDRL